MQEIGGGELKKFSEISIIYEDNHLLVVEKPVNIPSQPDCSRDKDLLTLLKEYIKIKYNKPGNVYLGLVHRLDRPVGGVMVFAKTSKAASRLSEQIRNGNFKKTYLAVVHGKLDETSGTLEHYLLKNTRTNIVSIVDKDTHGAKKAILDYRWIGYSDSLSLVKIQLHTGRPHQIRVQLSGIGNPIYGDQKYGASVNKKGQQIALWSNEVMFLHPTLKEKVVFTSNPPNVEPWSKFQALDKKI